MPIFFYQTTAINYNTIGKGSTIVLLHGFLEQQNMWDELLPILSKKNKVVTLDLFGHGASDCFGYVHTVEEQAQMIRALLKSINIRKATLIGHSMGGYVTLAYAALFPKNTKGICLLNSTAYSDSKEKKINRDRAIDAVKQNHKSFVKLSIPLLFASKNREALKQQIKRIISDAIKTPQQGIIASLEGMKIRPDRTDVLKNEDFKKMIILGEEDTVLPIDLHKKQSMNTGTFLVQLPNGHMSHIESFNKLSDELIRFINL